MEIFICLVIGILVGVILGKISFRAYLYCKDWDFDRWRKIEVKKLKIKRRKEEIEELINLEKEIGTCKKCGCLSLLKYGKVVMFRNMLTLEGDIYFYCQRCKPFYDKVYIEGERNVYFKGRVQVDKNGKVINKKSRKKK